MSTKTTTIRFNEEEQRLLDLFMEFQDRPLSTVLKDALFEDIMVFLIVSTQKKPSILMKVMIENTLQQN